MEFLHYLRGWIAIVGFMALCNAVACFSDFSFMKDKLYTQSTDLVNPLLARMFGVWTLLAAVLRLYCAIHITNAQVYNLTVFSFILALGHFLLETFVYKTAALTMGIIIPLIVSGASFFGMIIGYSYNPAFRDLAAKAETSKANSKRMFKEELLLQQKRK